VAQLQRDREAGLEQASNGQGQPRHRVTSITGPTRCIAAAR
jgi:hypothetical protein